MRAFAFGLLLVMAGVIPAGAQVVAPPRSLLDSILAQPPQVLLEPGFSLLGCCDPQRRFDLSVGWPGDAGADGLRLELTAGTSTTPGRTYSRTAFHAQFRRGAGPIELWGGTGALAGSGGGPRQALTATVGMGHPALTLELRATWLQDREADSLRMGSLPSTTRTSSDARDRYTDAELQARHRLPSVGLGLAAGVRFGDPGFQNARRTWVSAELELPVSRRLELVMAGGLRPDRPELAQVGGRFAQVGVRLRLGSGGEMDPDAAADEPPPRVSAGSGSAVLFATGVAPDRYRVIVHAPGARKVELRGDVTDWQTVALRHVAHGEWEITLESPPGLYHMNLRLDGGAWTVPGGIPAVPDRFGGTSGLLKLEPYDEETDDVEEQP